MSTLDKKQQATAALLDLTERETLTWKEFSPDEEPLPPDVEAADSDPVFVALYEGMNLYLYCPPAADDEDAEAPAPTLTIVHPESGAKWTLPRLELTRELFRMVRFRAHGFEEWMNSVIEAAEIAPEQAFVPEASGEPSGDASPTGEADVFSTSEEEYNSDLQENGPTT